MRPSSSSDSSSSPPCLWWTRGFLALLLKFLNFLQAFVGVGIIIYSIWMLNHWNKHVPIPRPPSAPPPADADYPALVLNSQHPEVLQSGSDTIMIRTEHVISKKAAMEMASGIDGSVLFYLDASSAPWFVYVCMGIGILLCSVTCIGFITAETINGCCLCFKIGFHLLKISKSFYFLVRTPIAKLGARRLIALPYTMLTSLMIIFEAALVSFMAFHKNWEEDLPYDPTGELNRLRSFIEDNIDLCRWIGFAMVIIQVLSLLLSMILRAMASSSKRENCDSDDETPVVRGGSWQPLIKSQVGQTSASTSNSKGIRPGNLNTKMREKYGLNMSAFSYNY